MPEDRVSCLAQPAFGVGHRSSEEADCRASELLAKDAILFAQIIDQVFLLAVQPPSHGQDEALQSMRHRPSLRGSRFRHSQDRPFSPGPNCVGRFFAPYVIALHYGPKARV